MILGLVKPPEDVTDIHAWIKENVKPDDMGFGDSEGIPMDELETCNKVEIPHTCKLSSSSTLNITQYLTTLNFTESNRADSKIKYIVIHYTGNSGDTAKANCVYFYSTYRGASAHYFVDADSIYQCVADNNTAWHCGTSGTYYHDECRNANSIGIELCDFTSVNAEVQANAVELVKYLMDKYGIDTDHIVRHYDVTHKDCPAPFVQDESAWENFKALLTADSASGTSTVDEYTDTDAIVYELSQRGIISDSDGMVDEINADTNSRLYWLARKLVQYIRNMEASCDYQISSTLDQYTDINTIAYDLGQRGIVSDTDGLVEEVTQYPNCRLYWLAVQGCHYLRVRD